MSLSLCVVGCGQFARTFAQAMQYLGDDIRLFFASREPQRAADYADAFNGIGSFGSYQAAAADPRVEAMYLCTPHHLHQEHAAMAAAAGKHILVEKPIARTLEEAHAIIQAAGNAGVTLMVAENYRFMATVRRAKKLIESGAIGDLRLVQLQEEALFQPDQWRNNRELNGGGILIDGGIHKVDILLYLSGRPEQVYAAPLTPGPASMDAEDGLIVVTRSKEGVVGLINHSWAAVPGQSSNWVSVSGTLGRISFELGKTRLKIEDASSQRTIRVTGDRFGLVSMVREFRDSIGEVRQPEVSGAAGLDDLAVVLKAYESMETGQPVTLD